MASRQLYFDHLMNLLTTSDALKETARDMDEPEDESIITKVATWIQDQLSAMTSYLRGIIKGIFRFIPGAGVGMCASSVLLRVPMVAIGAAAGVVGQWALSTFWHRIKEKFIAFLEKLAWPVAGAILGFWICGYLGAVITGCLFLFGNVDRYKSLISTLIGLTEEERGDLVSKIHCLVRSPKKEDLTSFISFQSERKDLLRTLFNFTEPSYM